MLHSYLFICPDCRAFCLLYVLYNTHNTNIHAPGWIRTRNPSTRSAADPRLRPLGHWGQVRHSIPQLNSTCTVDDIHKHTTGIIRYKNVTNVMLIFTVHVQSSKWKRMVKIPYLLNRCSIRLCIGTSSDTFDPLWILSMHCVLRCPRNFI